MRRIDGSQVRQLAIGRRQHPRIWQFQVLDDVGGPAFAEAFKGKDIDTAGTEQRPERHFDGAGVGGRDDPETPIRGNAEDGLGQIDDLGQSSFRLRCAVAATEKRACQRVQRKAGPLGAGTGREIGLAGRTSGVAAIAIAVLPYRRKASRWGDVTHRRVYAR